MLYKFMPIAKKAMASCSKCKPKNTLIITGPSGAGKTTFVKRLLADYPKRFEGSVSHTTRKPRPSEVEGVDYYFEAVDKMKKDIANNKFIEHTDYDGNLYGTSRDVLDAIHSRGRIAVLVIDVHGVKSLKAEGYPGVYVFMWVDLAKLEERLTNRNTENKESVKTRLEIGAQELKYGTADNFDFVLDANDDIERTYVRLRAYLVKVFGL